MHQRTPRRYCTFRLKKVILQRRSHFGVDGPDQPARWLMAGKQWPTRCHRCGEEVLNLSDRPVLNEICDPSSPPRPRKCLRWWPPECIPLGDDTRTMSNYFHTLLLLLFWCCCGPSMAVNRGDGGRVLRQLLVLLMNQGRSLLSCLVSCEWPSPSSPNNTS